MRGTTTLFLTFFLIGCSAPYQNSVSATSIVCEIFTKLSSLNFDETSSETLRTWVSSKFPNASIEDYSQTEPYDYTLEWEDNQIEYFANYKDGEIINLQVHINHSLISPRHVVECLGEPAYYSATIVGPQISIGLLYPEKGVDVISRVRDSINLPKYDDPIIQSIYFAKPNMGLEEFLNDINPNYNSTNSSVGINPWRGWENIEIFGLEQ